jgi:hypothetical protein
MKSPGFGIARHIPGFSLLLMGSGTALRAQDVVGDLPSLPSGFYEAAASRIKKRESYGDFTLTLGLNTLYDTNVTQGSDRGIRPVETDFLIQPTLGASYRIGNNTWHLGTRGSVTRLNYLESDEFNATNYSLGFYGGYQSGKLVASFTTSLADNSGFNRIAGNFIEQQSFSSGLLARYRFSPKTSLLLSWDQSEINSETEGFADTSSLTFGLSAVWQATPLLNIGPGFRYGVRTGFNNGEFTVFGPTVRLDYTLSTKVKLRSSFGLDSTQSPLTADDQLFNWSLALTYTASSLWGFDLEMIRDSRATLIAGGGFDQTSSIKLNYWRKIRRARLTLGIGYEDRDPQDSSGPQVGLRDANFLTLGASLNLPVFRDDVDLTLNFAWRDQSAADEDFSWNGFQSGVGLQWEF